MFQDSFEDESDEEVAVKQEFDATAKLFVGNLPFSVDSAQLAGVFGEAGTVEIVEVCIFSPIIISSCIVFFLHGRTVIRLI